MIILRWAAIAAALLLAACAGQPEIPFDQSMAHIKTIGIITPAFPTEARVVLASDVGQSFGLVGALIDAGMQSARDEKFKKLLADQKVLPADEFHHSLLEAVQQQGYTAIDVSAARPDMSFLKQLPSAPSPVDAYLDVTVLGYGYMAAGIGDSTPYRPYVIMQCKLERASDSKLLMQDQIAVNPIAAGGLVSQKQVTISDATYQFVNFDALIGSPDNAAAGMRSAFAKSTAAVGTLLK